MNFVGVPTGFILARTKRYKWMFVLGYGVTLAVMVVLIFFNSATPILWGFLAITLAGISMGAIPTLNTLVAQYAVPKRLLGVAMGALFFQYHDRTSPRACNPWLCHEYDVQRHAEKFTSP